MTNSSGSENEQGQPIEQNGPAGEPAAPAAVDGPVVNGVEAEVEQEEERTLTDHLNKRLLESFLARLDSGSMELPPGARGSDPPEEEDIDEFEDPWDLISITY